MTLIVVGLLICAWNSYAWWQSSQSVHSIDAESTLARQPEKVEKKSLPFHQLSTLKHDYKKGEKVAQLTIPKIDARFDVFWGSDEATLRKGVGMYVSKWTTTPNSVSGHTVLSGHRNTVFRGLRNLVKGDPLTVNYQGEIYTYRITKIWITDPDDRSVIVRKQEPTLTLTTCYPFDYIGNAPKRYIVKAELGTEGQVP
ncbi:class D sortase [Virgibacillus phasianinus]|uniref:Class D sortase n=1 Tax=Virgibacillus phasianinus TaxID=2017483 RepID=A0A220U8J2_9BACI|nr:class D sortase [Virgibacillus phasianinus]ASK64355.1 class D sortase [Virgibacillus phasianinus]